MIYVSLLCSKKETLDDFKVFKASIELYYRNQIKIVKLDSGKEYYDRHSEWTDI